MSPTRWPTRWVAIGYFLFFALLFASFPSSGTLPGNCDTWLNGLALPNYMLERLLGAVTGDPIGTPLYPETAIFGFGESAFGTSAIFMLFKLLTRNDVLAYYFFVVTLLALDSLGVYLLARFYVRSAYVAVFAGLAFSTSNYILGNVDSPHTSFFFLAFLCLFYCKRYLESGKRRDLYLAALIGGLQAYFSAYVFLFQTTAAGWIVLVHLVGTRGRGRVDVRVLAMAVLILFVVASPFFGFYAMTKANPNFSNPWDLLFLAELHSLEPGDLLRTLESNVLYPFDEYIVAGDITRLTRRMMRFGAVREEDLTNDVALTVLGQLSKPHDVKYFVYTRRCAFVGFVLYALAGLGLATGGRRLRWELIALFVVALVVSFGPVVTIGDRVVGNVTYPAYKWLEVARVLRVPARAFSFSVLALVLAAAVGLERIGGWPSLRPLRRRLAVFGLITAAVLVENVPVPLKAFAGESLATPQPTVREFFDGRHGQVLLDLPSRPGGALFRDSQDLFEWNRELIYMNRQTYHRQNIVNGVHGYFPKTRIEVQKLIDALPAPEAFTGLRAFGIDYIVYHHDLELKWEQGQYEALVASGELTAVASSPSVTIFAWAQGEPE